MSGDVPESGELAVALQICEQNIARLDAHTLAALRATGIHLTEVNSQTFTANTLKDLCLHFQQNGWADSRLSHGHFVLAGASR